MEVVAWTSKKGWKYFENRTLKIFPFVLQSYLDTKATKSIHSNIYLSNNGLIEITHQDTFHKMERMQLERLISEF